MKKLSTRHFNRLLELANLYDQEAHRCARIRAYYAACIVAGAALEAMLLAMCDLHIDEVTSVAAMKHLKVPSSLYRWDLGHMLSVARELGWLPGRSSPRAKRKAYDWATLLKDVRNFVHPGAHLRQFPTGRLRAAHYHLMDEILDGAVGWLRHRIESDLLAEMSNTRSDRRK